MTGGHPAADSRLVLIGGSGLLGSGFLEVAAARGTIVHRLHPPWSEPAAARRHITDELPAALADSGATVVWAAGVGHVGAAEQMMASERDALDSLCETLARLPEAQQQRCRLVLASSAGAVFGGSGDGVVTDESTPAPVTAYGREKLAQELLTEQLAATSAVRVLVCRYSNLYGLTGGALRPKGLVGTAVRAARLRQPMTVFVSADSRRDYLSARDAARISLALAEGLGPGHHVRLVADGRTHTVAEVMAMVRAVVGRRVPVTYAVRPETAFQPRALRFVPGEFPVARDGSAMHVALTRMAHAPIAAASGVSVK